MDPVSEDGRVSLIDATRHFSANTTRVRLTLSRSHLTVGYLYNAIVYACRLKLSLIKYIPILLGLGSMNKIGRFRRKANPHTA